jgi:hypothetical protein
MAPWGSCGADESEQLKLQVVMRARESARAREREMDTTTGQWGRVAVVFR